MFELVPKATTLSHLCLATLSHLCVGDPHGWTSQQLLTNLNRVWDIQPCVSKHTFKGTPLTNSWSATDDLIDIRRAKRQDCRSTESDPVIETAGSHPVNICQLFLFHLSIHAWDTIGTPEKGMVCKWNQGAFGQTHMAFPGCQFGSAVILINSVWWTSSQELSFR